MAHRASAALEIRLAWAGRWRTLRVGRWTGVLALVAVPLLAAWYLCASIYFVCHDDLLASLIRRQTNLQYAYEDRIAALKAQLDDLSRDAPHDPDMPRQAMRDLAAQAEQLDARAAALEAVARRLEAGMTTAASNPRQDHAVATAAPRHAPFADEGLDALASSMAKTATKEGRIVQRLREPILRRLARVGTALAETGLPRSRWYEPLDALGGPFVPLPDANDLDSAIALLRQTAEEQDRLDKVVDAIPLRRPLDGVLEVSSPFGPRIDPFLGKAALHTGIDLREETGDAVRATAAGTVTVAGPDGGYGNLVEIDHGAGLATRYGHLSAIEVAPGQHVAPGAIIGRVGATGRATGPHLHYETRVDGRPVDPARFLKAAAILFPK